MTTHTTPKLAGLICTYHVTNQGIGRLLHVVLPNGRKVELHSKKGADKFVDTVGTNFMSTNLTATDDQQLQFIYMIMRIVICNASPEEITSGIPEASHVCRSCAAYR
jgi:hypothetical protein